MHASVFGLSFKIQNSAERIGTLLIWKDEWFVEKTTFDRFRMFLTDFRRNLAKVGVSRLFQEWFGKSKVGIQDIS